MIESISDIDFDAMDEAMARFARGELREGILWLGRAHERLEPALRLYDAEKRPAEQSDASGRTA